MLIFRAFNIFLKSFIILGGILFFNILYASNPIVIDNELRQSFQLEKKLFLFIDSSKRLGIDEVKNLAPENFIFLQDSKFNFGLDQSVYWIGFVLQNKSDRPFDLLLNTGNSYFQEIDFFQYNDSLLTREAHFGSKFAFHNRDLNYRDFVFKIYAPVNCHQTFFIRIQNYGHPLFGQLSLETVHYFAFSNLTSTILQGVFFGILIYIFIINFSLYFISRERIYLFFSLLAVSFGLFQSGKDGFNFQYFWPDYPWWNLHSQIIFICLSFFTLIIFTKVFLHTRFNSPRVNLVLNLMAILFLLLLFLSLFDSLFLVIRNTVGGFGFITILGCFIASVSSFNKHYRQSIFFLFSFTIALVGISFYLGRNLGLFQSTMFTNNALKFCFLLQVLLFAFALSYRYRKVASESEKGRQNLEKTVNDRTHEINIQNEELRTQTEELEAQKEELESQSEELIRQHEILSNTNKELVKLQLVTSKTDNLIYIFDSEGYLEWFNDSFSSMLGYSFGEFKNLSLKINIRSISFNTEISNMVENCLKYKKTIIYETCIKLKDNTDSWYQTTLTPIIESDGKVYSLIAIDSDITRLKKFEIELGQQKTEYELQRNLAMMQKDSLEHQQKEMTDSIRYAKRIQSAILPNQKLISKFWPESFVLLIPKDIVSGDFYWYHRVENKHFIIGVDCTGHGVPGAFMSIIGTYLLNTIIIQNNITKPSEILKQLNRKIKISLNSENSRMQTNDGMDIAICLIDRDMDTLQFASAMRSLFFFSNHELIELKGDKIPISSDISGSVSTSFTDHNYKLYPGDAIYIFSDGIIDQFGGKFNKKFLSKRFKQILTDIQILTMKEQKELIQKSIEDWKGDREQVDDIMVIGIKYM